MDNIGAFIGSGHPMKRKYKDVHISGSADRAERERQELGQTE